MGVHAVESGDDGGQIAVVQTRAVRGRSDGSGDGDVREGCQVVDSEAALIDDRREVSVADAGADGDGLRSRIEIDGFERCERELILGAVGDAVEGVA